MLYLVCSRSCLWNSQEEWLNLQHREFKIVQSMEVT
jgi:hypothetical protein